LVRITAPDDLPHQVLMKEPLCLVVPLAGERVVFYGRCVQPVAHHWLTQQLRAAGLSTVLQEATLPNILATVAAGLAVSVLVSAYQSILRPPGIRFIPLDGLTVDLIMVWGPVRNPLRCARSAARSSKPCIRAPRGTATGGVEAPGPGWRRRRK
jgi:hypothetical protein